MSEEKDFVSSDQIKLRLKKSYGQLDGIMKMMDDGRSCEDVLVQLSAVKSSIDKAMKLVIAENIRQCVDGADTEKLQHSLDLLLKTK
ncbi:metal-sensitive transcriptional regulator [Companilactobacillus mishanensis]|uniref:Metal-sensitive transcriptional regulator n=1 Tax=Companilactobacillus mishanensis TaxID=2486008 RepID=A0A5P0ZHJ7_9LACO|nr:metal-sensitive transcriptional regulator [Companilactobacillus mishanensis]MQS45474.1 metal-sensitive transcriptional regulator [Companilactobacillus mishanensis]MQS52540.1 metal-sensitive transcriptional regulator [Companilactobacillus mishanensis]